MIQKILSAYNYQFSSKLIAQKPASPRDNARLLVYDRKKDKICYDKFFDLTKYLPKNAVLVFNETKVIPAKFEVRKETGGKARLIYLAADKNLVKVMADRKLEVGANIFLTKKIFFTVKKQEGKYYFLKPSFCGERSRTISFKNLQEVLKKYGQAPLPPYIKHSPLTRKELKEKYQAIFARREGSVAAPTASLHFTKRLMGKIKKKECDIKFITLHVNLGTFAPLEEKNIKEKKLHEEFYKIDRKTADFLNQAKKEDRPIIGVGTTAVRALESAANDKKILKKLSGVTDIFIRENYKFKFIDGIITNFHVPRSSLLMLVAAFAGRKKLLALYQKAINKKFRLFSFGDGMMIY